jgi:hypothetical protein
LDSGQILLACVFGNIPFETNNFDLGGFPVLHSFRATGSYLADTDTGQLFGVVALHFNSFLYLPFG